MADRLLNESDIDADVDGEVDAEDIELSVMRKRLTASVARKYKLDSSATDRVLVAGMLIRVRELLMRELDIVLSEFGTSHARYQVLSIVCDEPAGLQLGEIALRASVHPTTMTATIDRLERDGLLERRPDPNDRRGILAIATPKGQALYRQARKALSATEYGLADMDNVTVKHLLDGLDKVALDLERRDQARA